MVYTNVPYRASLRFEKKTEFLDKSSKTVDILPGFFEPKWSPSPLVSSLQLLGLFNRKEDRMIINGLLFALGNMMTATPERQDSDVLKAGLLSNVVKALENNINDTDIFELGGWPNNILFMIASPSWWVYFLNSPVWLSWRSHYWASTPIIELRIDPPLGIQSELRATSKAIVRGGGQEK